MSVRFAGYAALFGKRDAGRDTIRKGAFARSLAERRDPIPLFWQHRADLRVGWVEAIGEDERGLRVIATIDNDDGAACLAICACIACLITVYVTVMSLVACAGTGLKVMGSARDERNQPDTKFGRLLKGIALGLVLLGAAYLWYGTPGADHSIAAGITSAIAGSSKSSKPDGLSGLEIFGGFIGYGYGGLVAMVSMSALACCILGTCVFRCCGFDPLKYSHKQGDIALKQSGITEDQFNELKGSDYTDLFLEAQKRWP